MRDWEGVHAAFFTELRKPAVGICYCIAIIRPDDPNLFFTTHNKSLTFVLNGSPQVFKPSASFTPSATTNRDGMSVDNMSMIGLSDASGIDDQDLLAGKYDDAELTLYMGIWTNVSAGLLPIRRGFLGEIAGKGKQFEAELRALSEVLNRKRGRAINLECEVLLGDSKCQVSGEITTGTITSLIDESAMGVDISKADNFYQYGVCEFTSGKNLGHKIEIIGHLSDTITLLYLPPFPFAVSDTISLTQGCNKLFETCRLVFNNVLNFRGFVHMPTEKEVLETPHAK